MNDPRGTLIMELHHGEKDESPMHFVSAEQLRRYRMLEAELHALRLIVGWLSMHGVVVEHIDPAPALSTDDPEWASATGAEPTITTV